MLNLKDFKTGISQLQAEYSFLKEGNEKTRPVENANEQKVYFQTDGEELKLLKPTGCSILDQQNNGKLKHLQMSMETTAQRTVNNKQL